LRMQQAWEGSAESAVAAGASTPTSRTTNSQLAVKRFIDQAAPIPAKAEYLLRA
jgi:hypothetical protein